MAVQSIQINVRADLRVCPKNAGVGLAPARNLASPRVNLRKGRPLCLPNQTIASKIAFDAGMERARLNQAYWEELLKKLRRMGGGGGSDTRFDRVKVSMQLMNFLSHKMIQAIMRNFNSEFLKLTDNISNQSQSINQNIFITNIHKIGKIVFNGLTNVVLLIGRMGITNRAYANIVTTQLSSFLGILSFELNKLKEILKEELKDRIKKLDVKEKIRKMKTAALDFFVEMKDEILSLVDFFMGSLFVKNS